MAKFKFPLILSRFLKLRYFLIAIVFVAILAFLISRFAGQKQEIQYTKAKRGDIKQTVSASGTLSGKNTVNLKFQTPGRLIFVNFKKGDFIQKGQIIAGLDAENQAITLQQAKNNLLDKRTTLEKVLDDIHLFQYGNGGFANVGSANETMTQKQLRTTAETASNNAFDDVKKAEHTFLDTYLTSPLSGIITQLDFLVGQNVLASEVVAQVVDESEIYFDAEVDESDIVNVSLNQPVEITLNAYGDKVFKGNITEINPLTRTTSSGATVIIARVKLNASGVRFISGLNGQAGIITSQAKNVLAIPIDAIVDEKFVYIKDDKEFKKVEIEKGLSSDTEVEIKKGLDENQEFVTNPSIIKK